MSGSSRQLSALPEAHDRTRADYPVLRSVPLRWADTDTYGHVNNAVNYYLMDTAVNGWLVDATQTDIRHLPAIGVVVETGCRYFREVHFPSPVQIGLRLESSGRSSVVYEVGFFTDDDTPTAVARFVHVYVDHSSRRPVEIPQQVTEALHQLRPGAVPMS